QMIMEELNIPEPEAAALLENHKNVRKAIESYGNR
ncbi:MAG: N-acetylmuramic acid 6-phosphate etherase, partial [Flavobacterium sp.]